MLCVVHDACILNVDGTLKSSSAVVEKRKGPDNAVEQELGQDLDT